MSQFDEIEDVQLLRLFEKLTLSGKGAIVPGQQIPIDDQQIQNSAGGYVWSVDDTTRLRRFLILGTEGGAYYVSERKLVVDNAEALVRLLKQGNGAEVLREVHEVSVSGRAAKQNAAIFALAICARYTPLEVAELEQDIEKRIRENKLSADKKSYDELVEAKEREAVQYWATLKDAAYAILPKVCRIPTHLFDFVQYCETVSQESGSKSTGWGRRHRSAVAAWYQEKELAQLCMHMTKYQQRNGWSHRDLLRLCHATPKDTKYDDVFCYVVKGWQLLESRLAKRKLDQDEVTGVEAAENLTKKAKYEEKSIDFFNAFEELKATDDQDRAVKLIRDYGFVREHVPTKLLNGVLIWNALLEKMPLTAMIRNLAKMTVIGLIGEPTAMTRLSKKELRQQKKKLSKKLKKGQKAPMAAAINAYVMRAIEKEEMALRKEESESEPPRIVLSLEERGAAEARVVTRLTDVDALQKARVHPMAVLMASATYRAGRGEKGKLVWKTNKKIVEALDTAFELSLRAVEPTNKRFLLALDISGSMSSCKLAGCSNLSAAKASAAMSLVTARTEPKCDFVAFSDRLIKLPFDKNWSVYEMMEYARNVPYGATDCAQPMLWALKKKVEYDVFVVYTDNETWCGKVHPAEALREYRYKMSLSESKLIVVGMTASEFSIADPEDKGMFDVVGFDTAAPEAMRNFILGRI